MTDFASLGIELDSRPVTEGTKALDAFGEASVRVEQKVRVSNGQMADTSKIMRANEEAAKAAAAASASLGNSTSILTLGQQQLIERMREQAATVGMSRSQLMAYQAAQMGVTAETEKAIATVKAHEDAMRAAAKAKEDEARSTNQLTDALKLLAAGYALLKVTEYVKEAALMAARYETLGVVLEVVGRNAGYTKTQMDAAADGIARQGITMIESRNSAVKLVQAHVDLANATGLARIAQDAAVIGNINSSEAFDRLVNGISRGNVLILRNIGINVNLQAAYDQMAESLGKGTKELTENERVQARLNAVIERGTDIAGTYEAAMGTAGKQLLSMQRYIDDLKVKAGEAFNEVLTVGVMAFTDHLKDANGEVSELAKNGQLAAWGHDLAAVFVGVANAIDNTITGVKMLGTYAAHQAAGGDINAKFDRDTSDFKPGVSVADSIAAREARRATAFAKEQSDYEAAQVTLAATADRFQRAFDDRTAVQVAKSKAAADAKLKVDSDYAARSQALMIANSDQSLEIQRAAQVALAKEVYVGTPTYRDTEGRAPKDKADQAENTRLADRIKRFQDEAAAETAENEYLMHLDEMRHQAGALGDEAYYENRRNYAALIVGAEIDSYNKQLDELRKHNNLTETETAKNEKAIHDTQDKLDAAKKKYAYEDLLRDEQELLSKRDIEVKSDEAMNKYIAGLDKEAQKLEDSNAGREASKGAVERETVARLDLAIATQQQALLEQALGAATDAELAQSEKVLKFLKDERAARERIAVGLDQADIDKANKKASDEASRAWKKTADTIENDLTNAILDGGGRGWKKLVRDMEVAFAKMVLQSILQPIGSGIASLVNPTAPQAAGGAGSVLNAASTASSLYSTFTATGSGSLGAWLSGSSAVAPTSVLAANAAGAVGGDSLGTLIAAEGWSTAGAGAAGAGAAGASTAAASTGLMGSATAALAAIPVWGWAALAGAAAIAYFSNSGPEANTRLNFTSNNAAGNVSINERGNEGKTDQSYIGGSGTSAFGTFGVSSTFWMDAAQPAVQNFIKTVSQTDDALAQFLTATEKASVSSYLTGKVLIANTGAEGSDPNANGELDKVFTERINNILEGVEPGLSSLESNFSGTSQQLATEAEALFKYRAALVDAGEAVFGTKVTLQEVAALKLPTEATSAALARVTTEFNVTNQIAQQLGKTSLEAFGVAGLASTAAREQLIAAAGGIDTLAQTSSNFAQNYLTEAERLAPVTDAVNAALASLGYSEITTREQFKNLVVGLDLTTASGASTYASLMGIADAFAQVHPVVDNLSALLDLQSQLQAVTGDKAGAAAILEQQHAAALAALDPALRGATEQLWAAQAAASALADMQTSASSLLGGVDDAFAVVQKVVDREKAAITAAHDLEMKGLQERIDALNKAIPIAKSLSDLLHNTLDSMTAPAQLADDRASAQAQIKAALAIANAGGPLPTSDSLKNALSTVSKDASSLFATYQDYQRDFYSTQNDISSLASLSDNSLTVEQQTLDVLNAQKDASQAAYDAEIKRLDDVVAGAQSQIDELKGQSTSLLNIEQALKGLSAAILAAQANPIVGATSGINDAYQAALGRAPDAAGMQYWQNVAAGGTPVSTIVGAITNSPEAQAQSLFQSELGRAGDAAGIAYWTNALSNGLSIDAARSMFDQSDEYKKLHPFAVGTNFVPEDMAAMVHEGERIIPAADNRDLMASLRNPSSNNEALIAEVRRLTAVVEKLSANNSAENYAIAKHSKITADSIDDAVTGARPLQTQVAT